MAHITITIADIEAAFEISDSDSVRILNAFQARYTTTGQDGESVIPSPVETVYKLAQDVIDGLAAQAVQHDKSIAATTAANNVAPISVTVMPAQVTS
jgi:hypothetical protein